MDEGPPIHEDFCVDLFEVETKPWPRYGCNAAFVHLKGRGDFMSVFLLELEPGKHTEPQRHLFEEVVYVLSGTGSTTIETADGRTVADSYHLVEHAYPWSLWIQENVEPLLRLFVPRAGDPARFVGHCLDRLQIG